ncbi:hypothetical protein DRE_03428 [Drechslerella stenobrocha 248]|uniref:Major facilitator superfamily (MFS) profile domain-containing protein n=1 Tax=Drechslerella stenobrocha 248 TaxID=1043628 RepID=W7HUV3_9PEZI|nr:hypothetical protein DRE_03428 [Drechslerella stenobrocha 248]
MTTSAALLNFGKRRDYNYLYGAADASSSKTLAAADLHTEADIDTESISSDGSLQYSTSSLLNAEDEALLLGRRPSDTKTAATDTTGQDAPARIIAVLLLGVFIANGDGSFVLATNGVISSEFGRLGDASWLVTGYMLSMCAMQPLYGKMSDIYGRKAMLLISYIFFGVGTLYSGLALSLTGVIIGRAISGVGGAGMVALVSILITDLVPQRDIATWRAYVNIAATTGRSLGGPVGGYLTDTVGWRWSFAGQAPLIGIAAILVAFRLQNTPSPSPNGDSNGGTTTPPLSSQKSKLARIDFLGAFLLASTIVCTLLVLDLGGQKLSWTSPYILATAVLSLILLAAFCTVEAHYAAEPIFPLHLLRNNNIATSYGSLAFSSVSQIGIMYTVPRYFQITRASSVTAAGAQLVPAVVGNVIGGLITGYSVKKTGRYKLILVLAGLISSAASTLLILRWNGHTGFWESFYIVPGGFGMGLSQAASFVAMTAGLEKEHYAVATSGLYLSSSVGLVAGVSLVNVVLQNAVTAILGRRLTGPGSKKIIDRAIKDVEYIRTLRGSLRDIVVSSYIISLKYAYGVTLLSAVTAFLIGLMVHEKGLD